MATKRLFPLTTVVATLAMAGCSVAVGSSPALDIAERASSHAQTMASPRDTLEPSVSDSPVLLDAFVAPDRTVEETGGFKVTMLSTADCTAEAPVDWTMQAPDRSDRADIFSPDGSMYAGYGIVPVNTTLQGFAYAYPPPMDDPDLYSDDPSTVAQGYGRIIVGEIGGANDLITQDVVQAMPGYLLAVVGGSTHAGVIFFRETGYPGDGVNYSYALPMYFAFTKLDRWESHGALVARVSASIRCTTQLQPPDDYFTVEAADAGPGDDPNGDEAGYNPQLGTEPVNDPTTGENYLVDPSVNWSETGPDGPGYYVQKGGGDYQKLEPGRVD